MKNLNPLAATIAFVLSTATFGALANETLMANDEANQLVASSPFIVKGQLGLATAASTAEQVKQIITQNASYHANGNEAFSVKEQWVDSLGQRHTRLNQTINGLTVYGVSLIAHSQLESNNVNSPLADAAEIFALTGRLAVNNQPLVHSIRKTDRTVMAKAAELGQIQGKAELAYVYVPTEDATKLAWKVEVIRDNEEEDFGHELVFFDAETKQIVARHSKVYQAKNWRTYNINHGTENNAPGTLLCSNTQSCGDSSAQRAHDGASTVYDYYKNRFGRNSIDGNDMAMISSVHTRTNYNNAFWYNGQMFYGDGDGVEFTDLTKSLDVVGHELTHGVTEKTANLVYANASGALNEAWSDILGVSAESYKLGSTQPDWKLGEEVYLAGNALRYMNNPTADGYSKDWYPERIAFSSNPNNNNDQGGVHGNSGIANLAFVLTVDGGSHPRGKSTASVNGIGLAKAEKIFYRALTTYMSQSTDFAGARSATAQAAQDLYGATEKEAVETAWCAVGVGACPSTGTLPPISVSAANISVNKGAWAHYTYAVPAGYSTLTIAISGGTGDADMYVTRGRQSTSSSYDCRPYKTGNAESCSFNSPTAGTYYMDIYGYSAVSGVKLTLTAN